MKLMIASDIHGSAYWCKKMLEAFEQNGAEKLILLGDILYHGPRNDLPEEYAPKQVIAMLNPLKDKLLCVRGIVTQKSIKWCLTSLLWRNMLIYAVTD